jgi:ribosomal protein S27AE
VKNIEVKENRTLPENGNCRYCGGSLWRLDKNLWKCGHCLRTYSLKGEKQ